jgi:hypothetical protein
MNFSKPAIVFVAALVGLIGVVGFCRSVDADSGPDFSGFTRSWHVPFSRPVDFGDLKGLHIRVSVDGGKPITMQVDTGSVGVILGAGDVPNIDPKAPAGSIAYSSSGVELDGVWTNVTLTFPDGKDADGHEPTVKLPILAARERKVSGVGVNAAGTKAALNPKVYMFGIGFGRGKQPHPERNPFLNLLEMQAGTMNRGYTITRDGFELGLTAKNTGAGYVYQKLKQRDLPKEFSTQFPGLKDWETAPGSYSVGDLKSGPGTVLMDTGLTNMIISDPAGPATGDVADGTPVTVNLLDGKLHYSFKAGDSTSPVAPRRITWVAPKQAAYINTGLRAFAMYDYLFDADGGYLGLKPIAAHK